MVGVYAFPVVAVMAHTQLVGDRSKMDYPRQSVGAFYATVSSAHVYHSVTGSMFTPGPFPTTDAFFGNVAPETSDDIRTLNHSVVSISYFYAIWKFLISLSGSVLNG
jgi:hypothetical protein